MNEEMEKQMSSTNKKCRIYGRIEKIFNVRKIHYKQYDVREKCIDFCMMIDN
jgi:hypothetical protein